MKNIVLGVAGTAVFATIIAISLASVVDSATPEIGTDAVTLLLNYKRIPAGDFIHVYDSTPFPIAQGHVAVKVDCNEAGHGIASLAIGVAPELEVKKLTMDNMVHELSSHGDMCLYHIDLPPEHGSMITDVALMNTSNKSIRLGPTATVVMHVQSFGDEMEHKESTDMKHGDMGKEGMKMGK